MIKDFFKALLFLIVAALCVGAIYSTYAGKGLNIPSMKLGADSTQFVGGFTYALKAPISSSVTSLTLTSLTLKQTGQLIVMTDFGDTGYGTVEPSSPDRQEFISFTGITQNADGTATITGITRGLSPLADYTASTTMQFSHSGGSEVIFSNPPPFLNNFALKNNDESITGLWIFDDAAIPELDATTFATTSNQFVIFNQLNSVTNQGAATSSETIAGIIEQATAIETASSTPFDANNPHTINSENATSTPTTGCDGTSTRGALCVSLAENDGFMSQLWIDLTEAFTWTGQHIFSNSTTTFTNSAHFVGISTSTNDTLQSGLVVDNDTFITGGLAIGTTATTSDGNLVVSGLASTTNQVISGSCVGCPMADTASSTVYNFGTTGSVTFTGSIPAEANTGVTSWLITGEDSGGFALISRVGLTATKVATEGTGGVNESNYTFSWSGNDFTITENIGGSNANITGTMFWYK